MAVYIKSNGKVALLHLCCSGSGSAASLLNMYRIPLAPLHFEVALPVTERDSSVQLEDGAIETGKGDKGQDKLKRKRKTSNSTEKESSEKQKKRKYKINEKSAIGTTVGKAAAEQPKYGQISVISNGSQHKPATTSERTHETIKQKFNSTHR